MCSILLQLHICHTCHQPRLHQGSSWYQQLVTATVFSKTTEEKTCIGDTYMGQRRLVSINVSVRVYNSQAGNDVFSQPIDIYNYK